MTALSVLILSVQRSGDEVLYVRPDAVFNKSKPISGGLPHCFPQVLFFAGVLCTFVHEQFMKHANVCVFVMLNLGIGKKTGLLTSYGV